MTDTINIMCYNCGAYREIQTIKWRGTNERPENCCKCLCMVNYCGKLQPMILRYIDSKRWSAPGIGFYRFKAATKWIPIADIVDLLNANEEDGK